MSGIIFKNLGDMRHTTGRFDLKAYVLLPDLNEEVHVEEPVH